MSHEATMQHLKALKLYGMAQAADELSQQGTPSYEAAQVILTSLLKAEIAEREIRSIKYQIKTARFPVYRDLTGFNFGQSRVNDTINQTIT